jgi:hypothetical protein
MKDKLMNTKTFRRTSQILLIAFAVTVQTIAADKPVDQAAADNSQDINQLKSQLADQQRQIQELRALLLEQRKLIESSRQTTEAVQPSPTQPAGVARLGEVASTTPVLPPAAPLPAFPAAIPVAAGAAAQSGDMQDEPLQLHIGSATITPVGFMDMTAVSRSTNPGSGIGTNFGSIPYSNTQAGSLTETRLSIQNSRIGARFDGAFGDYKVLGYWESDFLGQLGNPPNGGLAVSSNPYVFRMRLYWVNINKGNWDFLAGQSWSLLTPGRTGISPLPSNLFFSQDIDVNYQAGLVWGRIPGFRGVYHFGDKAHFAVALENSEPYVGGGNGGSAITAPAAMAAASGFLGGQVNNGASVISAAALHPDIIAKLAFDPTKKFHFEIAGVEITNKIANPVSTPPYQTNTKAGAGASVNLNFELFKGFRVFTNNYWSDGGGRYIFGQAPDFIIGANGNLSLVHSASTVSGFEAGGRRNMFYAYYGGVYIGKDLAVDTTGKLVGYGPLSSDGQNRAIQEITFGTNTTLARDARWGALNLMFQYSYLQRNPWLATSPAPSNAHLSMGFVNLRYTLPGQPPTPK